MHVNYMLPLDSYSQLLNMLKTRKQTSNSDPLSCLKFAPQYLGILFGFKKKWRKGA